MTEFTPLVHDGIMFLWNFGETIQALDARNGNLLWQYAHACRRTSRRCQASTKPSGPRHRRQQAHRADDRHAHHRARREDRPTLWDVITDDHKSMRVYNGGPLVVNDKVIMGASGCSPGTHGAPRLPPGGCFITGHDLETGQGTLAVQHDRAARRAGRRHLEQPAARQAVGRHRCGPPSYDPELNLLYCGTGSPFPWSSGRRAAPTTRRAATATCQLHAGAQSRYRQAGLALPALPNDTFDQDYAFERLIVPVTFEGASARP